MENINKAMDKSLQDRVSVLHAQDDESKDGRIDVDDLKLQLDRIEAQLELQDQQNRALLKGQRIRLILTIALALILCGAVVFLWTRINNAYDNILQTSTQLNDLASQLQESLGEVDGQALHEVVKDLPGAMESLSELDVEALNEVLTRLPGVLDIITELQNKVAAVEDAINAFKEEFGNIGARLGIGST